MENINKYEYIMSFFQAFYMQMFILKKIYIKLKYNNLYLEINLL